MISIGLLSRSTLYVSVLALFVLESTVFAQSAATSAAPPADQSTPSSVAEVSATVTVPPGAMRFDLSEIRTAPGARVTIIFVNNGDMIHNFVVTNRPLSFDTTLAAAVVALGGDAFDKHFIPAIPEVIASSPLLQPGQKHMVTFTAPQADGDYAFFCTVPGHEKTMRGVIRVRAHDDGFGSGKTATAEPTPAPMPVEALLVKTQPLAVRTLLPDAPPNVLAVGLPGGLNYVFAIENLSVAYAWNGSFLDMAPAFFKRGGAPVKVLGTRFDVGAGAFPLSIGGTPGSAAIYRGYRLADVAVIMYDIGGASVELAIAAGKAPQRSLAYRFSIRNAAGPIHFKIDPTKSRLSSDKGTWQGGVLTVAPTARGGTTNFTVYADATQ